jgi:MYXO-CTERM domain-containing protein
VELNMRATPLLLWLVSSAGWAVRPPETTSLGFEPQRLHAVSASAQARWAQAPAWRSFAEATGWEAQFDDRTGVPHRMWGAGLYLGPIATDAQLRQTVEAFLADHAALLGLAGLDHPVRSIARMADTGAVWIDLAAVRDGTPVYHGGLTLRFSGDRLVMVGADTYPDVPITGAFVISADDAVAAGILQGRASLAKHSDPLAWQELVALDRAGKLELRRVWHTSSRSESPLGQWESMVDAESGELLYAWNTIRFISGQVTGQHDVRLGDGNLTTSPLPFAWISNGASEVFSAADGSFELPDAASYTVELDGQEVRLTDDLGDVSPTFTSSPPWLLTSADFEGRQAPLTTYVFLHQAKEMARRFDPSNDWVDDRVRATVNIDDVCNAYFDGTVNFFRSGSGCNNTGRLADVIFHEWGHGFHTFAIRSGFYDGSLGEGSADVFSALITDDSRIAPNFFSGGGGTLRDTDNNNRWPDDYVLDESYIHYNGLIFGGSYWDVRAELAESLPADEARDVTGQIWARSLRAGPTIETAYLEAVLADDDDGDLSNGTPHQCALVEGFGRHGLGPKGGQGLRTDHEPITDAEADVPTALVARIDSPAQECFRVEPTEARLHYRVNGGAWQEEDVALDGLSVVDEIPPAALGDVVEYWLEIDDAAGGTIVEPLGGPIRPHTFHVGDTLRLRCDDFEDSDGGFTHRLVDGEDVEGADDWQWGEPAGMGGDPRDAASGDKVWGNDLGGGDFNGQYQNDKRNQLASPEYKTGHYTDVFLRYQRWLHVEDAVYDRATIEADGEEVWSNWASDGDLGTEHHLDDAWADHVVPLGAVAEDGAVQVTWNIQSDGGLTFGGWTLDDVCLYAPATADNRLGVDDLVAVRDPAGPVVLTWTHPEHAPVTELVVVRKQGSWPTSATDGVVVWRTSKVSLGEPASILDPFAVGYSDLYYAVYPSDGQDFLSWTRPGLNAASIDPSDATGRSGCSCDTTGGPGWAFVGLGALLLRRRRR